MPGAASGDDDDAPLMTALVITIFLTLSTSAVCSLLEAFILSTTAADVEGLKKRHPVQGTMLERFKEGLDETSSAILTLNTIANTAGATVVGALNGTVQAMSVLTLSVGMTVGILVFGEVVPKNLGVAYRRGIAPYAVYLLWAVRLLMRPFSFAFKRLLTMIVRLEKPTEREQEEEIRLLAERSVRSGALSDSERELISNALSLDDLRIEQIMTPRTVVTFLEGDSTVAEVCEDFKNIPFARMPVFGESVDEIQGVVRRRDILQAFSEDKDSLTMRELMGEVVFAPETASALDALQLFTKKHQQFAVVVDEYGSTVGVISMEDIVEHLIGEEIYEESDVAVDMRELAKKRALRRLGVTPTDGLEQPPADSVPVPEESRPHRE